MRLKTLIKKIEECYSERQQAFWCEIPAGLVLLWIFAIISNLYVGFNGEIDPFNILVGGILIGFFADEIVWSV